MKVYPIVDRAQWYPKNSFEKFGEFISDIEFVSNPREADIIWILSYYCNLASILKYGNIGNYVFSKESRKLKSCLKGKFILTSVHHLTPSKEAAFLPSIRLMDRISDAIHFFSEGNIEANRKYFSKPLIQLPYWIDLKQFFPVDDKRRIELKREFGLPENKIIIGSFQRDTESDMVSPKLEKGPDVFCDIMENLSKENFFVFLSGERRHYVESRLRKAGVPFINTGKIPFTRMNDLYNAVDYYLVTSRVEGGPQAILEAMASGTRIYSTPVGISEILSPELVLKIPDDFVNALNGPYPDIKERNLDKIKEFECSNVVRCYEEKFRELLKN